MKEVLPRTYNKLGKELLVTLLKNFAAVPMDIEGDAFGKIYEYFLGRFAMTEGQKGGEFFTPISIVKLIVEIIEPFHGRIYDPACGSGGMFVQSAAFVATTRRQLPTFRSSKGTRCCHRAIRLPWNRNVGVGRFLAFEHHTVGEAIPTVEPDPLLLYT